jgi:AraC-like DNA-binding protein
MDKSRVQLDLNTRLKAGSMKTGQIQTGSLNPGAGATKDELYRAFSQRPFSVQMLYRQRLQAGEIAEYHTTFSAFIFTLSGRAQISFDDYVFMAQPHTVVHGCPGYLIRFEVDDNADFEHANIYYNACEVDPPNTQCGRWMDAPFAFGLDDYTDTLEQVVSLEQLSNQPSLDNRLHQIAGATVLVKNLFAPTQQSNTAKVNRVRGYLDNHYDQPLCLAELGDLVGMSPKHLSRCFSCNYGVSPMNYLITRRLEQAKLLLTSGLKVSEVAAMVGYTDPFYFSRLFKKRFGLAPRALRTKNA